MNLTSVPGKNSYFKLGILPFKEMF
jgi:hypothetical protein